MRSIDLDEFLDHATQLWENRGRGPAVPMLIMRVVKSRFCEWCGDLLIQEDPRIKFCNHTCATRSRMLGGKKKPALTLVKEKRDAA